MKSLIKFQSKSGRYIEFIQPSMSLLDKVLVYANRLIDEDTFITLTGKHLTFEQEKKWLNDILAKIQEKNELMIWAYCDGRIVGIGALRRGGERERHLADLGISVDKDFRREGIALKMIKYLFEQGKKMGLKMITLRAFNDNLAAIGLYRKAGFRECGRIPGGAERKGNYSDVILMYKNIN